ncbi:MAG: pseudouridine synthase [Gammaproteobacteria bacterium]|nr:pseudouridine synthase [Gammaproteobacteria bacterium]
MSEKLQKVLADRGLGSRRAMEKWIAAGRVGINGRAAKLGDRVEPEDEVSVDGRKLERPPATRTRVLVLNKRAGVIVSRHDPERRLSVFDELPTLRTGRWISVGRLDIQTTGLLLLTNNGELANRLMHPSTGIDREYAVRVNGTLDTEAEEALRSGVTVGDRTESFSDIRYYNGSGTNHWYHVVLMEGRNREVRDLFASQGFKVTRLKRVRYGPVILPAWLPRGAWEEMRVEDVAELQRIVGIGKRRATKGPARGVGDQKTKGRSMLIPYPELRPGQTG